jgi:RsiW-degrading membrane proteinase PrsW (M82 family)
MNISLFGLAIAPGLAIAIYIYWKDKFDKEPKRLMVLGFILGIISTILAVILEKTWTHFGFNLSNNTLMTGFYAFIVVGFSEELSKFILLQRYLYTRKEFDEPYDGITYSVMVSMGFATLENILYVADGGLSVAIMRMFLAVPAHAAFAIIMGYYVGLAKFNPVKRTKYLLMGLFGATALHGAYDFALMQQSIPYLQVIGAIISLLIGIRLSQKAIKLHQQNSPFRPI